MSEESKSKRDAVALLVALVAVLTVAFAGYSAIRAGGASSAPDAQETPAAQVGDDVSKTESAASAEWDNPALSGLTVVDDEGFDITLGTVASGKVTVINLWATWCPFCVDEMQDYQDLYDQYGDRIQFVMLDSAESPSEVDKAREYVDGEGFTFPVFFDSNGEVAEFFSVAAYPTTIVIDETGEVLSNKPGQINPKSMNAALMSLLN